MKVKLKGVALYPKLFAPDAMYDYWGLEFIPDKESEALLTKEGVEFSSHKNGDPVSHEGYDNRPVLKVKKKTKNKNGEDLQPPRVVDSLGNPVGSDVLIGNGSTVILYGNIKEYTMNKNTGIKFYLNTVQVTELVEYSPIDKIEGGYVASSNTSLEAGDEDAF